MPAELRALHRCPYAPSPCPSERKPSHHPSPEETHAAHACSLHPNNWPLGWRSCHAECSGDGSACHLLWGRNTHSPIPSMYPDQLRGSRSTKSNTRPRSILSSTKADENPRRVILAVIMTPFCALIASRVAVLFARPGEQRVCWRCSLHESTCQSLFLRLALRMACVKQMSDLPRSLPAHGGEGLPAVVARTTATVR
jgi:hypothetical protein